MTNDQLPDDLTRLRKSGNRAIAKQYLKMSAALRVIETWCGARDWFDREDIKKVAEDALRRFRV